MKFVIRVPEGTRIPHFYGIIYRDYERRCEAVCCPVPFNMIARFYFNTMLRLKFPNGLIERLQTQSYNQGFEAGKSKSKGLFSSTGKKL